MWGYCGGKMGLPMLAYFMYIENVVEVDISAHVLGAYSGGYGPYPSDLCSLQVLLLVSARQIPPLSARISYRFLSISPTVLCPYILPLSASLSYRSLPGYPTDLWPYILLISACISYRSMPVYPTDLSLSCPTNLCPCVQLISARRVLSVSARHVLPVSARPILPISSRMSCRSPTVICIP